jgi:GGDEF domain-containing protein
MMEGSAQGGVVNLLRMARTQCAVSIAFAALRNADGTFALATFPSLGRDGGWSVEAIDELAHQTWADPHLHSGHVLVRTARVPGADWPGRDHQVKLAVAPLSDLATSDRPWGLLCLADPAGGQFEQDHLDLLGTLAVRLTSYLRARQEVVENVFTVVSEPGSAPLEPVPVEWYVGGGLAEPEPTPPVDSTSSLEATGGPPAGSMDRGAGGIGGRPAETDIADADIADADIADADEVLGSMLRPDKLTGLVGLPSVLVHLSGAVGALRRSGTGAVALVLLDLGDDTAPTYPLPDPILSAVAQRLRDRVRNSDLLGRIGRATFAVVADMKPGTTDVSAIERRLADATRSVTASSGVSVRSTMTTVVPDSALGPEDVLRRAIAQLAGR